MLRQILFVFIPFVLVYAGLGAAGLSLAGSIAVSLGCALAAWQVHSSRESWAALGLLRPASWARTALGGFGLAALAYLAAVAALLFATRILGWAPPQATRFAGIAGDPLAFAGILAIAWTTAAFGEELLFRGFLQGRLQRLFARLSMGGVLAALLQASVFGLAHAYQGPTGMLTSASIGLVFGLACLRSRSIWPLVLAHGLVDSLSLTALFLGALRAG